MSFRRSLSATVGAAALSAMIASPDAALAQQLAIEEITVTARKRDESLQEIPLSITAFTADSLRQRNITNVYDLSAATPNFVTTPQLGRRLDRPTIRGQAGTLVRGEPNASYFVDGVFISGSATTSTIDALERVEIIRGPQSALFGRATFAGAVNFITRQPTDEFEGQFNATVASHDTFKASGWMSGPIIEDKLRFFASAGFDTYGGEWRNDLAANEAQIPGFFLPFPPPGRFVPFLTNTPQGGDTTKLGGEENTDVTLKLIYDINENHEFTLKGQYNRGKDDHFPALLVDFADLNCFRPGIDAGAGPASPGFFCGELEEDGRTSKLNIPDLREGGIRAFFGTTSTPASVIGTERDIFRLPAQYSGDFDGWNLVGRATWNRDRAKFGRDLDRTPARPVFGLFTAEEEDNTEDWAGELRLTSPQEDRLRGIFGLYYLEKRFEEADRRFNGPGGRSVFTSAGGITCVSDPTAFDEVRCDSTQEDVTNYAIFGLVEYDVSDELTLSLEGRYAEDEKIVRGGVLTVADAAALQPLIAPIDIASVEGDRLTVKDDTKIFTPRFTITYQPNDDTTLYGLVAKGDKPLDFNLAFFDDDTDPTETVNAVNNGRAVIKEEVAWTYELGAKTTLLDGRACLTSPGFTSIGTIRL